LGTHALQTCWLAAGAARLTGGSRTSGTSKASRGKRPAPSSASDMWGLVVSPPTYSGTDASYDLRWGARARAEGRGGVECQVRWAANHSRPQALAVAGSTQH
jgi:hypothetical protein